MSEDIKNDPIDRRKALSLFGLVAGAAGVATMVATQPETALKAAVQSATSSSAPIPAVKAPAAARMGSAAPKIYSAAPGRVLSHADSVAERKIRTEANKKLAAQKTALQSANEKKYKAEEAAAQKSIDSAATSKEAVVAREKTEATVRGEKVTATEKQIFVSSTVAAAMAPSLRLVNSDEWHLARRAAMGSNKALVDEITQVGYAKWVDRQLDHLNVEDEFCQALVRKIFPMSFMDQGEMYHYSGKESGQYSRMDMSAGHLRQSISNRVVFESMVELWRDHLHVKQTNDKNIPSVVTYDQTIREHAMGKFKDLFFHALIHPAMLHYLDNQSSRKANPNQNLGREMLELHTLGAGNHTENDVLEAARMLTGHSTKTVDSAREYAWNASYHSTGLVTLSTGFTHPNPSAVQAEATLALEQMCHHLAMQPSTATRIATKLCVRFVSDTPPAALVKELADIYRANDTDIKPVLRALFNHASFKAAKGAKWRRPSEASAMMFRAAGLMDIGVTENWARNYYAILSPLRAKLADAGHEFQQWDTPDGYPDKASHWMAPTIMLAVWNMTETYANQAFSQCTFRTWAQVLGVTGEMDAWFIADVASEYLYGMTLPYEERRALAGYLATGDDRKYAPQYVGVGDAVLNARLKNMMRMLFCNPRMMIR